MNQGHSSMHGEMPSHRSHIKTYLPLILVFSVILSWTISRQLWNGFFNLGGALNDFMGGFFLIFGLLQIVNWKKFADSFAGYDLLASRSRIYSYLFPLIELALAAAFLFRYQTPIANWVVIAIFSIASIGVIRALKLSANIPCACLGGIFSLPLSGVTLFEDLLMVGVSIVSLLIAK